MKRWYQLSNLQFLVAITCGTALAYANGTVVEERKEVVLFFRRPSGEPFVSVERRLGWPLTYRLIATHTLQDMNDPWVRAGRPFTLRVENFKVLATLTDAVCAVVILGLALRWTRSKRVNNSCPSPRIKRAGHE